MTKKERDQRYTDLCARLGHSHAQIKAHENAIKDLITEIEKLAKEKLEDENGTQS